MHPTSLVIGIMFPWFKITAVLVIAAIALEGESTEQQDDPSMKDRAEEWLEHVKQCRRDIKTIQADFVQERIHPLGSKTSVMKGTIEAKRGGLFRLTYTEPNGRVMVSDGDHLWAYNPGDRTVVKSMSKNSLMLRLLNFFVEDGDRSLFVPRYLGGDSFSEAGSLAAIELVPKNRDKYIESIILTVNKSCPAVTRVLAVENKGAVIRVSLENIQTNKPIRKRRFVFVPPKGSSLINP